jgi:hypothetical protein
MARRVWPVNQPAPQAEHLILPTGGPPPPTPGPACWPPLSNPAALATLAPSGFAGSVPLTPSTGIHASAPLWRSAGPPPPTPAFLMLSSPAVPATLDPSGFVGSVPLAPFSEAAVHCRVAGQPRSVSPPGVAEVVASEPSPTGDSMPAQQEAGATRAVRRRVV